MTEPLGSNGGAIAMFVLARGGGGTQRAFATLAQGFAARGHPVDLLLGDWPAPMFEELAEPVRCFQLPRASRTGLCRAALRLPAVTPGLLFDLLARGRPEALRYLDGLEHYLREHRPRALLSTITVNNLVALWARKLAGSPTRCVVREAITVSSDLGQGRSLHLRGLPRLLRTSYAEADAIVAVSHGVAEDLAHLLGLAQDRVQTIYNPFDLEGIRARAAEPLDHPWLRPGAPPVLLGAGRLRRQKDFATLVRAFARVRERREARLIVLGEGKERERLQALASELGVAADVELPGFVENPYAFMARASVFVLSSRWEGLANVLVEALACGTPVVSTRCPSGAEEVLGDGIHGRLVAVGDDAALAEAVDSTLESPPDAEHLRERAGDFSLERSVTRYLDVLLGGSERPAPAPADPGQPPLA